MIEQFHQSAHYQPLRDREVARTPPGSDIRFSERDPAARNTLFNYFNETTTEYFGVLHGEFLLIHNGLTLVDRDARLTSACTPPMPADMYEQPWVQARISESLREWDNLPLLPCLPVITSPYVANYYHFSLELIPRIRHFTSLEQVTLLIQPEALTKPFQRDLLVHTLGRINYLPLNGMARIRDPLLVQDTVSEEGLLWLRRTSGITTRSGKRRIYIRRGSRGTRSLPGGGIAESDAFLTILREFSFEVVEFGAGELGVAEQVAMLDGAGVILASHGAALTNLTYLHHDVTVIEIIGRSTPRACFIHLAATIGMRYYGIYSSLSDDRGDVVLDADELRDVLCAVF